MAPKPQRTQERAIVYASTDTQEIACLDYVNRRGYRLVAIARGHWDDAMHVLFSAADILVVRSRRELDRARRPRIEATDDPTARSGRRTPRRPRVMPR